MENIYSRKENILNNLAVMVNVKTDRSVEINVYNIREHSWKNHRLLKEKTKLYKTAIRPVITYVAGTMCLTE